MAFVAYEVSLQLIRELREPIARLAAVDPDEARQLRSAASSIVRNLGEGSGRRGADRRRFYLYAEGSACEVRACVDAADAWGIELGAPRATLDRLCGLLWGLTH